MDMKQVQNIRQSQSFNFCISPDISRQISNLTHLFMTQDHAANDNCQKFWLCSNI